MPKSLARVAAAPDPAGAQPAAIAVPQRVVAVLPMLSGAAAKLLLYIIYQTENGRVPCTSSLRELAQGALGDAGQVLNAGTGLSKPALLGAIAELEEQGLLTVQRRHTPGGCALPSRYTLIGGAARDVPPARGGGEGLRMLTTRADKPTDPTVLPADAGRTAGAADQHDAVKFSAHSTERDRIDPNLDSLGLDARTESIHRPPPRATLPASPRPAAAAARPPVVRLAPHLFGALQTLTGQLAPGAAPAACKANATRLRRLWDRSGLPEAVFAELVDLASTRTLTRVRQPRGRPVGNPISYFFGVLERLLADSADPSRPGRADPLAAGAGVLPSAPPVPEDPGWARAHDPPPAGRAVPVPTAMGTADPVAGDAGLAPTRPTGGVPPVRPPAADPAPPPPQIWPAVLLHARLHLPPADYDRVLRYAILLELDPAGGRALVGLPSTYLRDQVAGRLAAPLGAALSTVCGTAMQLLAVEVSGAGPLAGPCPSLATVAGGGPAA